MYKYFMAKIFRFKTACMKPLWILLLTEGKENMIAYIFARNTYVYCADVVLDIVVFLFNMLAEHLFLDQRGFGKKSGRESMSLRFPNYEAGS